MFSEKYIEYVKKTANPAYTVEMAACALMEEIMEFDDEEEGVYKEAVDNLDTMLDELGDVYYQFVLFVFLTGIDFKDIEYIDMLENNNRSILAITSQFKKLITRGKQLDIDLIRRKLSYVYSDIMDMTDNNGYTVEQVEKYNIEKLDRRYKDVNAKTTY